MFLPVCLLLANLTLVSCTQRETDIGSGAITDLPAREFLVLADSATRSVSFRAQLGNGGGQSLQIGDAAGFRAFFGMRFWPARVMPDSATVDSMELVLRRASIWPATGAPDLSILVREIKESWVESSVSDSLFTGPAGDTVTILSMSASDTLLSIRIPDSLKTRWLGSDTSNYGLLFQPASTGTLIDFYSSEAASAFRSRLILRGTRWVQESGVWRDTALVVEIPNTSPPNDNHVQDVYVAQDLTVSSPGRLTVSSGAHRRCGIYFPISAIQDDPSLTVVRAELRLYVDTTSSNNLNLTPGTSPLFTHGLMRDTVWFAYPDEPDSARGGDYSRTSASISAGGYYAFDVSNLVANWVYQPERNTGIQVLSSDETGPLGRQVFHGLTSEDVSKRPRLLIWLTESR